MICHPPLAALARPRAGEAKDSGTWFHPTQRPQPATAGTPAGNAGHSALLHQSGPPLGA